MISKDTLDKATQKQLSQLLMKSTKDLTVDEIGFLMARRDYLTESELKQIPAIEEAEVVEVKPKAKRKFLK